MNGLIPASWEIPGEVLGADTLPDRLLFLEDLPRIEIRAEEAKRRIRSFLRTAGRIALHILSEEVEDPEPIEVRENRDRMIANAALHAAFDLPPNPAPPVHRYTEWADSSNPNREYRDSVTNAVERKFARRRTRHDPRAPYGYFGDTPFHIIGRDSPVRGGVYASLGGAAVLAYHYSPQMQERFKDFETVFLDMYENGVRPSDEAVLWKVREYVREYLPYDGDRYDSLVSSLKDKNGIIPMSELLDRQVAICDGQAAFGVSLLEHLIDRGFMRGRAAVERSFNLRRYIGHAHIAFDPVGNTNPANVLVADMSGKQGFVGTREQARSARSWWLFDVLRAKR